MNFRASTFVKAGLLTGTLDILSAFLYYFIMTGKTNFEAIFRFIATGLFGKAALSGGAAMILAGLLLHYFIAFIFTLFFFWLFPKIKAASVSRLLTAIVYGIFVWCMMNLVVVPLSFVPPRPFHISGMLINIGILIMCFGVPLSWMAGAYHRRP